MSDRPEACKRLETQSDQQSGGDGNRRAEAGGTFEKCAKAEGNEQQLEARSLVIPVRLCCRRERPDSTVN